MTITETAVKKNLDFKRAALILLAFVCGGAVPIQLLTVSFGYAQYVKGVKPMMKAVPIAHEFASAIYIPFILLPALVALVLIVIYARNRYPDIARRILVGAAAGAVATISLDAIRLTGVVHGWLPADTPVPFGKLITGSDVMAVYFPVGVLAHYTFGANFGIFYAFVWGRRGSYGRAVLWGVIWALLVELGMMTLPPMAPALGPFGINYMWPHFFLTTLFAHILFGITLGLLVQHFLKKEDCGGPSTFLRGPA
tara:strand:+ start:997 stop:1755 length:759 start_codon:yes stop_codon:yes gene_type:complete